jgi:nucleoside-diphosphate-sugar epimerase
MREAAMKVLVLGASGATGRLVVLQLIKKNIDVRIVVRESAVIPVQISENKSIETVKGNINDFDIAQIKDLIGDCDCIVCCLGHNINLKGIFGHPHKLVFKAIEKITQALHPSDPNKKLILMSTTAYTNKKEGETDTFGERAAFNLLERLLPPHKDNMLAANHLIYKVGSVANVDWVAVRPDSLFDEEKESEYEIHHAKTRSPIFNPGRTSRINVSHFMAELLVNDRLWQEWKHRTPAIYNKE